MKKLFIAFALLLFFNVAKSQVLISLLLGDKLNTGKIEFGLEGGGNWGDIKGLANSKSLRTFNLGFYFDFKIKDSSWMFNTGVIVKSTMGADELPVYSTGNSDLDSVFVGGKIARKINYFNVPIMMKYTFKNHIFLKGGIQLGLRYKATDEFQNSVADDEDLKYKLDIKNKFHPIDAGLAFGAGYRWTKGYGMNFGVQYYYGLIDISIEDSSPDQFNRVVYLTVGIPIGKGKSQKKKGPSEPIK